MIEKDLPVYTYTFGGFAGKSDYHEKLREHIEEKKSRIK